MLSNPSKLHGVAVRQQPFCQWRIIGARCWNTLTAGGLQILRQVLHKGVFDWWKEYSSIHYGGGRAGLGWRVGHQLIRAID